MAQVQVIQGPLEPLLERMAELEWRQMLQELLVPPPELERQVQLMLEERRARQLATLQQATPLA
jgi:hypothetical protein